MKNLFLLILMIFTFECFSMGGKSMKPQINRERKDQDKIWRPCQDFEVKNTETRNPIGKLCNRKCISRNKNRKCIQWKQNIKDFNNRDSFLFFRNGSFVMIDEDNL